MLMAIGELDFLKKSYNREFKIDNLVILNQHNLLCFNGLKF